MAASNARLMEPLRAKKLRQSIRLTLQDLEKNTELSREDSRALADLKRILLLRLADLEAAPLDEPSL